MDIRDFAKELEKCTLILGNLGTLGIYSSFTSRKNPAETKKVSRGLLNYLPLFC
jgi:hypothetical protein